MLSWYKRWRRSRYLRDHLVCAADFSRALGHVPACRGLDGTARDRLRQLVTLFLNEKVFNAVGHAAVDPQDQLLIAVNACLPILNLGIEFYDGWTTVIVYPNEFVVEYEEEDETGVVHSGRDLRTGEAWEHGPLIISLSDVHAQSEWEAYNVVIHECAHQLEMRNGAPDGLPPLHRGMSVSDWIEALTQAYEDLHARIARGEETPIDEYAAESPAECFAVFSEYFFEAPQRLRAVYPAVYDQLVQFYRQDPATRLESDLTKAQDSGDCHTALAARNDD